MTKESCFGTISVLERRERKLKKALCNKLRNVPKRNFVDSYMSNGVEKAIQMRLRKEGIKVHKMDLRPMRYDAERLDTDCIVGNAKQGTIIRRYKELWRELENDIESSTIHDMTRWKESKKKTKSRK